MQQQNQTYQARAHKNGEYGGAEGILAAALCGAELNIIIIIIVVVVVVVVVVIVIIAAAAAAFQQNQYRIPP